MVTLKTLPISTRQEVFNQIANHLLSQRKSSTNRDWCAYRGSGGLKCAAGCLISDQEYCEKMEGNSWDLLVSKEMVPEAHQDLIVKLQRVHDFQSVRNWKRCIQKAAMELGLEWEPTA